MKVKELIELLQTVDPEQKVFLSNTDPTDYCVKMELSFNDINLDGDLLCDNDLIDPETESEYEFFDEDDQYIGPTVVVINLDY